MDPPLWMTMMMMVMSAVTIALALAVVAAAATVGINGAGVAGVRTPNICMQHTIFVNVIDCVVGTVVEQVYSGTVTCSRDNTRRQYNELTYFYLKMHQNVFGGRALPGPARGAYSAP